MSNQLNSYNPRFAETVELDEYDGSSDSEESITMQELSDTVTNRKLNFRVGFPFPSFRKKAQHRQVDYSVGLAASDAEHSIREAALPFFEPSTKSSESSRTTSVELEKRVMKANNPEDESGILSTITFGWVSEIFKRSNERRKNGSELEQSDMFVMRNGEEVESVAATFLDMWKEEFGKRKAKRGNDKLDGSAILRAVLWKLAKRDVAKAFLLTSLSGLFSLCQPILLNNILRFIDVSYNLAITEGPNADTSEREFTSTVGYGFILAGLLALATLLSGLFRNYANHLQSRIGFRWRSSVSTAIYTHALVLGPALHDSSSVGAVLNHMQVDAQEVEGWGFSMHFIPLTFIQLIGNLVILYLFVDWYAFAGVGSMLGLLPIAGACLTGVILAITKKAKMADERTKKTDEMLQSMQGVKMSGWENFFITEIEKFRTKEYKLLQRFAVFLAFFVSTFEAAPALGAAVAIVTYVGSGNLATASVLYVIVSSFNQLKMAFNLVPQVTAGYGQYRVSCGRIAKFLATEAQGQDMGVLTPVARELPKSPNNAIEFESTKLAWKKVDFGGKKPDETKDSTDTGEKPKKPKKAKKSKNKSKDESIPETVTVFDDLTCKFERNKLTALVGPVGSGKSTVLSAVIGDLVPTEGIVRVADDIDIAYVAQTAWMMNASLRDNILFGNPYDAKRYQAVIKACQLEHDLQLLDQGDKTMIGEKGINLSGGQKQRISIARAAYSTRDLVILDDPLSALDPKVANKVFEDCIIGLMRNRTRILVTNQLNFLKSCDSVIVLEVTDTNSESDKASEDGAEQDKVDNTCVARMVQQSSLAELEQSGSGFAELMQRFNEHSGKNTDRAQSGGGIDEDEGGDGGVEKEGQSDKLMTDEERSRGAVNFSQYVQYMKVAGGCPRFIFVLICVAVAQGTMIFNTSWIAFWTDAAGSNYTSLQPFHALEDYFDVEIPFVPQPPIAPNETEFLAYTTEVTELYSTCYAVLILFMTVTAVLPAFSIQLAALSASRKLHGQLLKSVTNAPMSFFDTTPLGRIVARFSKDVDELDFNMGGLLLNMVLVIGALVSSLITISSITPYFAGALVPISVFYWYLLHVYRPIGRDVKRIEAISRSPVYAQFSETLTGLSTVRAYGRAAEFQAENQSRVAKLVENGYTLVSCVRWRSFRLELLNFLVVFGASFFAVEGAASGTINSGLAGLSLTFALTFATFLGIAVMNLAEFELAMNSVERVLYYANDIPQEGTDDGKQQPPKKWPQKGAIVVNNLMMKYRHDTPLVLNGISFQVNHGERIGVVGRTGSGKSSLMLCFLRLVEPIREPGQGGPIIIDGVDICKLDLKTLRSRISIVPQHPVVFAGSIRMNLDPEGRHSDAELWESLERCNLKTFIAQDSKQLDMDVSNSGGNLSQGQRQLLSLARTQLEQSKVLLLDEATSSIDFETDSLIQKTLRDSSAFENTTMLVIAHRINTVIDSDRILVLQNGQVAEYDTPSALMSDSSSVFAGMVAEHSRS